MGIKAVFYHIVIGDRYNIQAHLFCFFYYIVWRHFEAATGG